jgi:hypothetical protein
MDAPSLESVQKAVERAIFSYNDLVIKNIDRYSIIKNTLWFKGIVYNKIIAEIRSITGAYFGHLRILDIISVNDIYCNFDDGAFLSKLSFKEPKTEGYGTCDERTHLLLLLRDAIEVINQKEYPHGEIQFELRQITSKLENFKI